VACGGSKDDKSSATTTTRPHRTTTTLDPVAAQAAAKLEPKLIKTVPAGYTQEDDSVGDTGPSDLAKAVRDDGSDDAREVLTREGFVAGYQRYWTKGDDEIIDFIYQFATATGANDYLQRSVQSFGMSDEETTSTAFAVPNIPGAKGFTLKTPDGDSTVVVFARGTYLGQVIVNGADATPATVQALAKQQYDNLA
jgi:hypothetical protein